MSSSTIRAILTTSLCLCWWQHIYLIISCWSQENYLSMTLTVSVEYKHYLHHDMSPVTSLSYNPLCFPQNPVISQQCIFKVNICSFCLTIVYKCCMSQMLCEDTVRLHCWSASTETFQNRKCDYKNINTHTVNSERLTKKWLLLFLRPVALALFLRGWGKHSVYTF